MIMYSQSLPATTAADDDGSVITLLYYLSKRAMCSWTEQDYATCQLTTAAQTTIETMAAECTTYGNVALANSNVGYVYQNVHVHVDMDYDEGSLLDTYIRHDWITELPAASALLDQYHADLLVDVYWRSDMTYGAMGIGWIPSSFPNRGQAFSSQVGQFSFVSCCWPELFCCALPNAHANHPLLPKYVSQQLGYIIAHEIGHNMVSGHLHFRPCVPGSPYAGASPDCSLALQGLKHNREQCDGGDSDKSNYGWNNCQECFMTIMSYQQNCRNNFNCANVQEIQYFSNTETQYTNSNGAFAVGDEKNNAKATLELAKVGVAMNRLTAPQLLAVNSPGYKYTWPTFTIFSVIAKRDIQLNNIEFHIAGDTLVELFTAVGSSVGKEMDTAFWGTAHVSQAISRANNSNNLIEVDVFQSFPTLSLFAGSTTNFKIQTDGTVTMLVASHYGTSRGDVGFENDAMQFTVGPTGEGSTLYSTTFGTPYGAFRYTVASAVTSAPTKAPTSPPTDAPTKALTAAPQTSPPTKSPTKAPTSPPTKSPIKAPPTDAPTKAPTAAPQTSPPTKSPTKAPTSPPTKSPTKAPTSSPTESSSASPSTSNRPSVTASSSPSGSPSKSDFPTTVPSMSPSNLPSASPSTFPSGLPSKSPSEAPSGLPSPTPSDAPSMSPSAAPIVSPSSAPTLSPSATPSTLPTRTPSASLGASPTQSPSSAPSRMITGKYEYNVTVSASGPVFSTDVTRCRQQIQQFEADMQAMTMLGSVVVKIVTVCTDNVCVTPPCGNGGRGSRLAPASTTTLMTDFTQTVGVTGNLDTPTAQQQVGEAFVGQVNLATIQEAVETPANKELAGVDFTVGALSVTTDFSNVTLSVSAVRLACVAIKLPTLIF